ncbi:MULTISPECIES: helix-turn-helix domain-containing protein [Bacillus subtilis group]|uniref:XRE family transcriptional regulator n=2 Tax=Bacillus subtilis group TaxID=653685 RepID=A0AAI8N0J6_9BACI|nr:MULTISPECIES: helix-turn-helix transcriptional regulator [Bacillus subtilis group]AUJ77577.1 XRE family transcriptional regulator [Bacillus siamensis]MCB7160435.1 helix-turn-helix domain-containing protein [Bacillus subtilis]MCB7458567.1 helix-turn-helix domain-containing protein [Bacillus subtilis]MCY8509765.1 helix-turn-helix domain-containing protein [Bacillus mojavensis]MED4827125.1 helix-turn-helix transcriptional regulator [Bacillus atrophaeus]
MNPEEKKRMGLRIRELRKQINLSQEALAERLEMKRTNIANYEAGRVVPPGNIILQLAEIFEVTTDYLLGRSDNPKEKNNLLDDNLRQIQRAKTRLKNDADREKMDRMVEMIKLSFVDAFEEDDDEDDI